MCIGCHGIQGYQASFPEVHKVPMISGQGAKYIVAALTAYKKGERKHPTMRGIAGSLTEQDMADLGAYYEQHGASMVKAVADDAGRAALGRGGRVADAGAPARRATAPTSASRSTAAYPKLAGQHADYLFVALKSYAVEGKPQIGRSNAIMGAQVKQFKPRRTQGHGRLPGLAAGRTAHGAAVEVPLTVDRTSCRRPPWRHGGRCAFRAPASCQGQAPSSCSRACLRGSPPA